MWKKLSPKGRLAVWIVSVFLIFILAFLLLFGVFRIFTAQSRDSGTVTFTYGVGARRDPSIEGERSVYFPNGTPYVNFSRLCDACGFSQSGDKDEIRFLISKGGERYDTVTFYYNSRKATVNGMHVTLSSRMFQSQNDVMIPCDFIELYMSGITVEATESRIRVIYEEGNVSLKPDFGPLDPIEKE